MALQYNVSQLLKSGVGETREFDFQTDQPMDLEDAGADNIRGHVKFTLTNFSILANVRLTARLHLICARCLEPFGSPIEIAFEEEYQPSIDIATGLPSTVPRSEMSFAISQNHTVDLREAIRQNLVLAVELVPVCSQDCKGLCAGCGINLNIETCTCAPPEQPNPFTALAGLFSEERN